MAVICEALAEEVKRFYGDILTACLDSFVIIVMAPSISADSSARQRLIFGL